MPESWLDADAPASSGEFVRSLHRGFVIIRAFGPGREELTLSEVAAAAGLSRPVARRYLLTLAELGYVRAARHRFALRRKVLELGYSYLSGLALTEIAAPHMADLVARLGYTCSLAVLDGADLAYVGAVPARRIMGARASVGALVPARETSMGRVLLACQPDAWLAEYLAGEAAAADGAAADGAAGRGAARGAGLGPVLAQVRADGFALMDHELEPGLRAIAVPVRTRTCGAAAALNVSASMSQVTAAELCRDVLPELRAAALRIAGDLAAGSVVQP